MTDSTWVEEVLQLGAVPQVLGHWGVEGMQNALDEVDVSHCKR